MGFGMREEDGKTIVQVKVPVCVNLQLLEEDAERMTQDELCGLVDGVIDQYNSENNIMESRLRPRGWMQAVTVRYEITRHWDDLPVDEMELMSVDEGLFEKTGLEDDE